MKVRMIFGTRVGDHTYHSQSIQPDMDEAVAKALIVLGRAEPYFAPGEVRHSDPKPEHRDPVPEAKKGK